MKYLIFILIISFPLLFSNCKNNSRNEEKEMQTTTPVEITTIQTTSISEYINLNAVSSFQKKNYVKSNINGYIEKTFISIGDYVETGKLLFILKTKEANALGNSAKKDGNFYFNGEMKITAPTSGIITEVTKQANDYVADGEQLCIVAEQNSLVFLLSVPFELNKYVRTGSVYNLLLPDSTYVPGTIVSKLSTVDAASQTQNYIIKIQTGKSIPENLLATVLMPKNTKKNAQVVDKKAVLTDETMENFWVMKLINDSMAIKIPIIKGITTDAQTEIISPQFNKDDRIISNGNYGLSDTAFVKIIQIKK
ncbi:MAG: HlyD family efflux transporter periplasmic adaptor subunit [Bacteroidetes bacterium]|nr:HlyD family efflux transporter periplasmic adaptor subunit [Bacteroidota bacterium]